MCTSSNLSERLSRIGQKIQRRGIRLGPCLTEDKISAFEEPHGIVLPDGYRFFLRRLGNGGPGPPGYGLAALGDPAGDMRVEEARIWTELPHVQKPFPFSKTWVWEGGDLSEEGANEEIHSGSIYLGTDGCGMYWHLIVTGAERGNVWQICGEGLQPTDPKRDFLRWYEEWLDGVRDWWAH